MDKEAVRPRAVVKSATAFRTISEVSDELEVPQHVLRFWETKFPQVRPLKRGGGRRYYRPEDVALLRKIQRLLYSEGYTIKGVQRLLKDSRLAGNDGDAETLVESLLDAESDVELGSPIEEEFEDVGGVTESVAVTFDLEPALEAPRPVSTPEPVAEPEIELLTESGAAVEPEAHPVESVVAGESVPASLIAPVFDGLPAWHRAELEAVRAELIELKSLLRKAIR